jgi:hypothetical protein
MAPVTLSREEARDGDLPLTCMRCGAAAGEYQVIFFPSLPWWIYPAWLLFFLPFLVWVALPSRRMKVLARLCDHHARPWRWRPYLLRDALVLSTIFFVLWVTLLAVALSEEATGPPGRGLNMEFAAVILLTGVFVYSLPPALTILALVLHLTSVRAKKITKESITLTCVADEFVEALRVHRQAKAEAANGSMPESPSHPAKGSA